MICQECKCFEPQSVYDNLLGLCSNPLVVKALKGKPLVNNTSEELTCGKRGKKL